jgi:DUF305 family protein family protein
VKLMLPHHQGAVDMAKTELLYGIDPQMRRLAQEIITDQESDIQLMQLWLKRHDAKLHDPNQTPGLDARKGIIMNISKCTNIQLICVLAVFCALPSAFGQQAPWGRPDIPHLRPRSGVRSKSNFKHGFGDRSFHQ